jgi:hypothetical protein
MRLFFFYVCEFLPGAQILYMMRLIHRKVLDHGARGCLHSAAWPQTPLAASSKPLAKDALDTVAPTLFALVA